MANGWENSGNSERLFFWAPKSLQMVMTAMKLKDACSLVESHDQHTKKQRHYFAYKFWSSESFGFSSSHVWMWELDYKESWAPKNWCCWTVMLEKTLESLLDCKEIQPVHPKGDKSWVFIGRTDAEAETPVLWPPDAKNWLISKDPDAGKDWRWEEKGWQRMRLLDDITDLMTWVWVSSGSWWWTRDAWGAADHGVTQSQTWLSYWTELDSWGKSVLSQDDFITLIKALQVICTLWIKILLSEAIS